MTMFYTLAPSDYGPGELDPDPAEPVPPWYLPPTDRATTPRGPLRFCRRCQVGWRLPGAEEADPGCWLCGQPGNLTL